MNINVLAVIFQVNVRCFATEISSTDRAATRWPPERSEPDDWSRRVAARAARPGPIARAPRYRRWKIAWVRERERENDRIVM